MVKVLFLGLEDARRAHVAEILSTLLPEVELWDGAVSVCQSNKFMNWWINRNETNWSEGKSQAWESAGPSFAMQPRLDCV